MALPRYFRQLDEIVYNLIHWGFERFGKYYSTYRAVVTDNVDPLNQGRLQLYIPIVHGPNQTSEYWAYPKGVFSGKAFGMWVIPRIGDIVWVEFEQGDPSVPVWSLGHFGEGDVIEPELQDVSNYWFRTPGNHLVQFSDTGDFIDIKHSGGSRITLSSISISVTGFGSSVVLNNDALEADFKGTSSLKISADLVRLARLSQSIFIDKGGISVSSGGGIFIGNPTSTLNPVGQVGLLGDDTRQILLDIATILGDLASALDDFSQEVGMAASSSGSLSPLSAPSTALQLALAKAKLDIQALDPIITINESENITTT